MNRHACRTCSSDDTIFLGICPKPIHYPQQSTIRRSLYRCRVCHLVQCDPIPSTEQLIQMYRTESSDILDYASDMNAAWQSALRYIAKYFNGHSNCSLLDIGCHTGKFLSLLPLHWARYGIESNGAPSRIAEQVNGVQIIAEQIEAVSEYHSYSFDVVTMFDVLLITHKPPRP